MTKTEKYNKLLAFVKTLASDSSKNNPDGPWGSDDENWGRYDARKEIGDDAEDILKEIGEDK